MRGKKNGAFKQTLFGRAPPTGSQTFYNDATASPGEDNTVTDPNRIEISDNVEEAQSGASEDGDTLSEYKPMQSSYFVRAQ